MSILAEATAGVAGTFGMIAWLVILFVIMYFLMIRPQKKEQKRKELMLSEVATGDTVLTTSGFYGTIIDIPFPNIPPHANEEDVIEMAHDSFMSILHSGQEYGLDVLNLQDYDITIHCMGELSFVWYVVSEARKWSDNIHCVVSTTERNVVENTVDGVTTKTTTFEFVKFREMI